MKSYDTKWQIQQLWPRIETKNINNNDNIIVIKPISTKTQA